MAAATASTNNASTGFVSVGFIRVLSLKKEFPF
jgi:hypothetical protein